MHITIISDASYCHTTHKVGFGFWIACKRGKMAGEGILYEEVTNSNVAEMRALVTALHVAVRENLVRRYDKVMLQTDCQGAIQGLDCKRSLNRQELDTYNFYKDICDNHNLTIVFRHVKGHTNLQDARFRCNNACDRRAHRALQKARNGAQPYLRKVKHEQAPDAPPRESAEVHDPAPSEHAASPAVQEQARGSGPQQS